MGQAFHKLFDAFFGTSEMRVVMLGLDAAGKTTILYKLHIGEVMSTVPTIEKLEGDKGEKLKQELIEKLSKRELPLNEYPSMNEPSSTTQRTTQTSSAA